MTNVSMLNSKRPSERTGVPALALSDVRKIYTSGNSEIRALDGIFLEVVPQERIAILGKSGCGKSTLMNLLGGLDRPDSGTIRVRDRELSEYSGKQLAAYRRHDVGMVYQSFNLIPNRTAIQNVELPLIFAGVSPRQRRLRAQQILDDVELSDRQHHYPSQLSGGQQQRVAIARALIHRPSLLLADEPCGNLDSHTADQIVDVIRKISEQCQATTLLVTHDREMADQFADRVITMRDGRFED